MVASGLQIIRVKQRRGNLKKLGESLEQLQCALNGTRHCEELIDSGQLEMAMHRISYVKKASDWNARPKHGHRVGLATAEPVIKAYRHKPTACS